MRCPEFREIARSFLDGEVDDPTRREFALHLAECSDCARLIEEDRFWDDTLRDYLNHELPDGLRESILGDLAQSPADMGWRQKLRVIWWAGRRDLSPKLVLQTAALAAFLILALNYLPFFQSSDKPGDLKEAYRSSGPIVQLGEDADWNPEKIAPTARLSLSGRLI
jgi:anti-sigma factor RsiW